VAITAGLAASTTGFSAGTAAQVAASSALGALSPGPFEFAARVPAKAWKLGGCLPTRYKAGSDFEATSSEISITELDVEPEALEEFSLSA
jgi:hypothetical protein